MTRGVRADETYRRKSLVCGGCGHRGIDHRVERAPRSRSRCQEIGCRCKELTAPGKPEAFAVWVAWDIDYRRREQKRIRDRRHLEGKLKVDGCCETWLFGDEGEGHSEGCDRRLG